MLYAESRRGRRIVGSIERGAELLQSLASVCAAHGVADGEVRASGLLEAAVVDVFDRATERHHPSRIGGGLELLALHGTIRAGGGPLVSARATLVRLADPTLAVVGGRLTGAVAEQVDFVIESFDDIVHAPAPAPALDEIPALPVLAAAAEAPIAVPPAPPPVLAAVEPPVPPPAPPRARIEEDILLAAGDILLHPRFLRCLVVKVESNHEYIQVQLKNGRVVRLSLEVLQLSPLGVENGQRIFTAAID
jgi:predicted DNA-binding protein with PD1-like motif